jgi:hypothetical protein
MTLFKLKPGSRTREVVLLLTVAYLLYLPLSGYSQLYYDGQTFWDLATRFITRERHFSLLHYSMGGRGYTWPLVLVPLRTAWKVLGGEPIWYTRVLGAVVAGFVFGWLGPRLYQRVTGAAVLPSLGRRLAFAAVGFLCWRDYFNFPLTDFPALLVLGSAMLLVLRPRLRAAGLVAVGALLGLAFNIRPIYQLSAGLLVLAVLWPSVAPSLGLELQNDATASVGRWWQNSLLRLVALLLGFTLVLSPQFIMHRRYFPQESPWHLGGHVRQNELVVKHLAMGLVSFKYETNVGNTYPEVRMWYPDPVGQTIMRRERPTFFFTAESQYWDMVRHYPLSFAGLYLRRLFDGLDIQYPTPYVRYVYSPPSWPLALLNYTVLLLGLGRLLYAWWAGARPDAQRSLVLLALLLPCLGSLPMAVEVRFMLPLHLLLAAAATLGWPQSSQLGQALRSQPSRAALLGALFGVGLLLCFSVSADTQAHLEHGARLLTGEKGPPVGGPVNPRVAP